MLDVILNMRNVTHCQLKEINQPSSSEQVRLLSEHPPFINLHRMDTPTEGLTRKQTEALKVLLLLYLHYYQAKLCKILNVW